MLLRLITRLVLLLVLGVLAPGEAAASAPVRVWPSTAQAEKLASWGEHPETAVLRQAATMQAAETQQAASSLGYDFASGRLLAAESRLGTLTNIGENAWQSSGGLKYTGLDRAGLNRIEHVLRHTVADPSRRVHSVFSVPRNKILSTLDEAWGARGTHSVHPQSGNWNYRVDLGRAIGTNGETAVNISVRPGTSEIITAFPVR